MQWSRIVLALALAVLGVLPAPASAQIHTCGPFQIVFRNPDLQPDADGFITAEGQFFAQFQVIGEGADKVTTMGFSFGAYTQDVDESQACPNGVPSQLWFSGQQVPNYRADTDPSDGFFINLQTPLVPDGQYTAAVHAYDANDNELGRFWARAVVDNCDGDPPAARCDGDAAQNQKHDRTGPWPMILPGDGSRLPDGTLGFSLEFAEELSNLTVALDGQDITKDLEPWDGRLWDDDLFPGYGPNGLGAVLVPECSQQPPQTCSHLGVSYRWNNRTMTGDDVIHVEATDLSGNKAVKDIHVGSSVAGGAITDAAPNLQITVDALRKPTSAGQSVVFNFDITNSGGGTAHPFTRVTAPAGWDAVFSAHRPIEPGQKDKQELTVTPPAGTPNGDYRVNASIDYSANGGDRTNPYELTVTVGGGSAAATDGNATAGGRGAKGSPAPAPTLVAPLLVAVALLRRRGAR